MTRVKLEAQATFGSSLCIIHVGREAYFIITLILALSVSEENKKKNINHQLKDISRPTYQQASWGNLLQ
jgi:hypothetical protein